jgi:phage-related protein
VFQVIGGIVGFIVDLLTGHFDKLSADLGMIWQGIINIFLGAWTIIAGIFQTAWYTVSGIVTGFVDGLIGFFKGLSDALVGHSIIPDMINGIVKWFAGLPQKALDAVHSLLGLIGDFFSGLAKSALDWGANIVKNVASGITNAIGFVTTAVQGVANAISNFLPHSPAKVGPLVDLENSGAMISKQISTGMMSGKPNLQVSMAALLTPIATPATGGAYRAPVASGVGGQPIQITNIFQIDGQQVAVQLADYIGHQQMKLVQLRQGIRSWN